MQQPPMQRPPTNNAASSASAPTSPVGYAPYAAGHPPQAGAPYRPSATPPPLQQQYPQQAPMMRPPFRPGMPPQPGSVPGFPPGAQPPAMVPRPPLQGHASPMMRPPASATPPPVNRMASPPTVGMLNQHQPPSAPGTPPPGAQSPQTPQSPVAEHHKPHRKRLYPEQITNAYLEQSTLPNPVYPSADANRQVHHPYPSQVPPAPANVASPVPTMTYQNGAVNPMQPLTNQLGNMNLYGTQSPQNVPLLNTPAAITDLETPPPAPRLPPNTSVTDSPMANSDPSFQCCTINAVPFSESLLKKSKLPLAIVLAPYRTTSEGEQDLVPVISDSVIARCRRCRAYINPFVTFVEGGQRWKCNMCNLLNDVPASFDYDPKTQQTANRWKRAELNYSCVEYIAPTEYMVRSPQAPAYVFVIDVSVSAVQSGMVATAARTILDSLDNLPNKEGRTSVGFITVDSTIHFYNLDPALSEPQMLVVNDLDDVYLPQPNHLLVNLKASRSVITTFLEKLPDMFKDTTTMHNALGSALQAAFKMVSPLGGKIVCLQSTLPDMGTGALKNRQDPKVMGTAKETPLLNAASPFYKSFAIDCSRSQVACDMLLCGDYNDHATLSCLPRYTGGQTYYYPGFHASKTQDALKFVHEFSALLAEEIGLEAVLRVRASRGLRMNSFHGNFFIRSSDLLALPNVPRNQSYCVEVAIEDELKMETACFQTALLHTACNGERRIRVITQCLPITKSIPELYAAANQQAIIAYLANKAIERGVTSKLEDARDAVINKVVDLFGVYKTHVMGIGKASAPDLTAPVNLNLLPLLGLALIKNDALRLTSQITADQRSNAINLLRTMPIQLLLPYLYPNMYALHNMGPGVGEYTEQGVMFPPALHLTTEQLEVHGCYLLENGQAIYIWVGRATVPQLCIDLFDVPSYAELRAGKITLPVLETQISKKTHTLIGKIREKRRGNYYPIVYLVKEDSDPHLKATFLSQLIEDRTESVINYRQFLQQIKERVNSGSF